MKLSKPLVFLDLETTGTDILKDRILEIALIKIMPDGSVIRKPEPKQPRWLLNPQTPISAESSAVHGIYQADVQDKPTFADIAKSLYKFLFDCDLAGFNSNKFDIPLLVEEFMRVGIDFDMRHARLVDVQTIFHLMEERTLSAGYRFYCQKELENAHDARADVDATYEIFLAQLQKYQNVQIARKNGELYTPIVEDIAQLHETCRRQNFADLVGRFVYGEGENAEDIYFNFGKYKGEMVKAVLKKDPSYYDWMMKGDFALFTKKILQEIKAQHGKNNIDHRH